jgi:hypothetical protein
VNRVIGWCAAQTDCGSSLRMYDPPLSLTTVTDIVPCVALGMRRKPSSSAAGSIHVAAEKSVPAFQTKRKPELPLRYELLLNFNMSAEARYATLVHENDPYCCGAQFR